MVIPCMPVATPVEYPTSDTRYVAPAAGDDAETIALIRRRAQDRDAIRVLGVALTT